MPTTSPTPLFELNRACPAALLEGRLVRDERWGVAIEWEHGRQKVRWPHGYFARLNGRLELVSGSGVVVAREGDRIGIGGGFTARDEEFIACDNRLPS